MDVQAVGGGLLLLCGVLALGLCLREMHVAGRSAHWRPIAGTVHEVEITRDGENNNFHVEVHYRYRIDGQEYNASKLRWGPVPSFPNRLAAEQYLSRFRSGHPVMVYVDPARPARSVLLPGLHSSSLIAPFFACIPIIMGASMLLRSITSHS
jgi:hypothetical protein